MKIYGLFLLFFVVLICFSSIGQAAYLEVTDGNVSRYQNNTYTWTGSYVTQFTKIFNVTATADVNGSFYFSFDHKRNSGGSGITSIARKNGINFSDNTHYTEYSVQWFRDGFVVWGNVSIGDSIELWIHTTSDGNFSIQKFEVNYTEWGLPFYQGYNDLTNKTIMIGSRGNQSNISDIIFRNAYDPNNINFLFANVSAASTARNDPYQVTKQNLSAWVHMDDNLSDVSGNVNHGQLFNTTARHGTLVNFNSNSTDGWKPGISGNAIQTDGVNDYVNVTTATSWDGLGAFSVGARIKFNVVTTADDSVVLGKHQILALRKEATTNLLRSFAYDNSSGYNIDVTSNVVAVVGVWYNITLVYNGTGYTFYVDDRYNKSAQMAKLLEETTLQRYWQFGGVDGWTPANVTIDDAWGLRRAATLAEIQAAKNGTYPKDVDFYYSFNETTGTTANDTRTPEYVTGKYNTTVNFNGTRYISISDSNSLDITSNITIESFVQFNQTITTDQQVIIAKRSGTTVNYGFDVFYNGTSATNELRFYYYTGAAWHIYESLNANLKASTKYYVAVSFAYGVPSSMKVIVNDTILSGWWQTGDGTGTVSANTLPVTIGSLGDGTGVFYGIIDEVIISNKSKNIYELNDDYYIALSGMNLAGKTSSNLWEIVHWSNELNNSILNVSIPYVPGSKPIDRLAFSINDADTFYSAQPTSALMNGVFMHDFRNNTYFKINVTINNNFKNYSELYDLGAGVWVNLTHTVPVYAGSSNEINTIVHSIKIVEYPSTIFTYTYLTNLSLVFTAANASNVSIDGYQFINDRLTWNITSTADESITYSGYMMNGGQNFSVMKNNTKYLDIQSDSNNYFSFTDNLVAGINYSYNVSLNHSRLLQIGHDGLPNVTEYSPTVEMVDNNVTMFFTRNNPASFALYGGDDTLWKAIKTEGGLLDSSAWSTQLEVLFPGGPNETYQIADPDVFVQDNGNVEIYYTCIDAYWNGSVSQSTNKICHAYSVNNGSNWTKKGVVNIVGLPDYIINPNQDTAWGRGEPSMIELDDGTILMYFTFLDNQGHNGVYLANSTDPLAHNFTYVGLIWSRPNPQPPLPWYSPTADIIRNGVSYVLIGQYDWHTWAYLVSNDPYDFSISPVRYFWHSDEDILSPTFNTITPSSVLQDKVIYFGAQNGTIQYPSNPITYGTVYGASIYFDILAPPTPTITSYSPESLVYADYGNTTYFSANFSQTMTWINWTINGTEKRNVSSTASDTFFFLMYQNGTYFVEVNGVNINGNASRNWTWIINNTILNDTAPASITNPQTSTGNFFINNTWTNPADPDLDHIWFRYSNGTTLQNVSSPTAFLNRTWSPHYTQNISAQTVGTSGNINSTRVWFNATIPNNAPVQADITDRTATAGQWVNISVDVTDADSDVLTYFTNATSGSFGIGVDSNKFAWQTAPGDEGVYYWSFWANDSYNLTTTPETIQILIMNRSVSGYVKTASGQGVRNVAVTNWYGFSNSSSTSTGFYQVNNVTSGNWTLNFTKFGYNSTNLTVSVVNSNLNNQNVTMNGTLTCDAEHDNTTEIIYVFGANSTLTIPCLYQRLENESELQFNGTGDFLDGNGEYILKKSIVINGSTVTFVMNDSDVKTLKILDNASIGASQGKWGYIQNVTIGGWNESRNDWSWVTDVNSRIFWNFSSMNIDIFNTTFRNMSSDIAAPQYYSWQIKSQVGNITNSNFEYINKMSLYPSGSQNITIANSTFFNSTQLRIDVANGFVIQNNTFNMTQLSLNKANYTNVIGNNIISNNTRMSTGSIYMWGSGVSNNISFNDIHDNGFSNYGIQLVANSQNITSVKICCNVISGNINDGINGHGTQGYMGIDDVEMWNNTIRNGRDADGDGIYFYGNGGNLSNFWVHDNQINESGDGICLQGQGTSTAVIGNMTDSIVERNRIHGMFYRGVLIGRVGWNITVRDNIISDTTKETVKFWEVNSSQIYNITGTDSVRGFDLSQSKNNIYSNFTFSNITGDGTLFTIYYGSDNNLVRDMNIINSSYALIGQNGTLNRLESITVSNPKQAFDMEVEANATINVSLPNTQSITSSIPGFPTGNISGPWIIYNLSAGQYKFNSNSSSNITGCGAIYAPGSYYLTQNLSAADNCIVINSDDVSIDGRYYTINYSQVSSGSGIIKNNFDDYFNITIKNVNIIQGSTSITSHAIYFYHSNFKIENNTVRTYGDDSKGILVWGYQTTGQIVQNNTVQTENSHGIVGFVTIANFLNNNATSDSYAMFLSGSNTVIGGNTYSNSDYYISGSKNNITQANFSQFTMIQFANSASSLNFSNTSSSNIRLFSNVSVAGNVTRKVNSWTQDKINISDIGESSIVYYWIENGNPDIDYYILINNTYNQTIHTDGSGNTDKFGLYLTNQESVIVMQDTFPSIYTPPAPVNLANTTGSHWVNHTWQAGSGNITDSYNVMVNGTWYNLSVNPFYNNSIIPHGWSNITVCAYNNTGVTNYSCISQNTQINNSPISISGISPTYTLNIGNTLNIDANYADADSDTGTFARNFTEGTFNTGTGVLAWSTGVGDLGDYYWQINVSDGYGSVSSFDFVVHIVESGGSGTDYDYLTGYVTDSLGPVNGALIETSEGSTTTNAFGYYSFGYLFVDSITYWINVSKVSYLNNNTQVTFSSDHQWWNATLAENPNITATLTGHTFDSNTGSYLSGVNVNISQYNVTTGLYDWYNTTSDGSAFYQLFLPSNKSCEVVASKTGYYDKNINFTLDNTSYVLDIYLINISLSGGGSSTSIVTYSSEHDVRYIVLSLNGTRYPNTSVLGTLSTANGSIFYIGTTGSDGSVVFRLNGTYSYNFTFTGLGSGFVRHWTGYPFDTTYFIYVDGNITFTPGSVPSNLTNYTINYTNRSWSIQNITSDYLESDLGIGILGQGVITATLGYVVAVAGFPVTNIVVLVVLALLGIVSWIWVLFVTMTMISFYVLSGKVG